MSRSERPLSQSLTDEMFRAPVNKAMRVLDRSFFQKEIRLAAALVKDKSKISSTRQELTSSKAILARRAVMPIQTYPGGDKGEKCILLRPDIKHDDPSTWTVQLKQSVSDERFSIVPFSLHLDYSHWPAHEILEAILPEDMHDDIPSGFNPVGHIAHFNLRPQHLPYKSLIGEVTIDKNAVITTVVNKTENLGESEDADIDQFRVLPLEVIASTEDPPNFLVEVREGPTRPEEASEKAKVRRSTTPSAAIDQTQQAQQLPTAELQSPKVRNDETCVFKFDFSKVFWNSRLGREHTRLVDMFKAGEVVCDVMAGVGPFAIPAGKKRVFVWANDLNPHCLEGLQSSIKLNKVEPFVQAFCEDGHTFIKDAARRLYEQGEVDVRLSQKQPRRKDDKTERVPDEVVRRPRYFSHFVMNLPATAIDFVPDFVGIYSFLSAEDADYKKLPLPMVHCYCFGPKPDPTDPSKSEDESKRIICEQLSEKMGFTLRSTDEEVDIVEVRNVAPHKSQFCASFRLPEELAYKGV